MNDFFARLFEFFHYDTSFSNDLYNEHLYSLLGLIDFVSSLVLAIAFYYVINRPSFSKWQHWLIILGIDFAIAFSTGAFLPRRRFTAQGLDYAGEYYAFGIVNACIAALFFICISFMIRWWSTNAKRTPFPH